MTVGDIIKEYRINHGLSQRQFAIKCNLSNGYISMLEKGVNPKTQQPIMPSITLLKTIADAMNISLNELLTKADDMPVNLSADLDAFTKNTPASIKEAERVTEFIELFSKLTPEQQSLIIAQIKGILSAQ